MEMKETKEMLKFIISLANAVGKAMEDGSMGLLDMSHFMGSIASAGDAFNDSGKIVAEFKAMTVAQRIDLVSYVKKEFDLPQDNIEAVVEKSLDAGMKILDVIESFSK